MASATIVGMSVRLTGSGGLDADTTAEESFEASAAAAAAAAATSATGGDSSTCT